MTNGNLLGSPVLVLNASYEPIHVCVARRALILLLKGVAAAEELSNDEVRSPSKVVPVPSVIRLLEYRRIPRQTRALSRKNILLRDRYTCQYCGCRPGSEELTIDHVTPRSQGGISSWDNCVLACVKCNSRKADRTPEQAGMPLAKKPYRPAWRPMFAARGVRIDSWTRFLSEAWWNVELEE